MFNVSRPMLVAVLKDGVTETKDAPAASSRSTILAKSASDRVSPVDLVDNDPVYQITVRSYPVREVYRRLGVSTYSLYKWLQLFGEPVPKPGVDHEAENRRLKRELARVTEERDILEKGASSVRNGR